MNMKFLICITVWCMFSQTQSLQILAIPKDLEENIQKAIQAENDSLNTSCNNNLLFEKTKICPPSKFRHPNGECNNVSHRKWGARADLFLRILSPHYEDNVSTERRASSSKRELPEVHDIVKLFQSHIDSDLRHPDLTVLLPAWGQLLAKDMFAVGNLPSEKVGYTRSAPGIDEETCRRKYREQINLVSAYIDGSSLYGTSDIEIHQLRTYINGGVKIYSCKNCLISDASGALHRILLQHHNNIAEKLASMNSDWSEEDIFLESRKIVAAQIQHITYNEFLPIVLGKEITSKDTLRLTSEKYFTNYTSSHHAGIYNEFALGVLPVLWTMYPPEMVFEAKSALKLLTMSALQTSFNTSKHLIENTEKLPILELSILRGRDHGLPPYLYAFQFCDKRFSMEDINNFTFEALSAMEIIPEESITILKDIYESAKDIDMLVGAMLENPSTGSLFGPTVTCFMKYQFELLKKSDRFWYENDIPPSSFNSEQLKSIRQTTLSGLLCDSKEVLVAQPNAFFRSDNFLNSFLNCSHLNKLELRPWQSSDADDDVRAHPEMEEMLDEINLEIIQAAVERAKVEMEDRKRFEYNSWLQQGGISAKSPDGTAASFSKANRNALLLANSSLMYELTSNEIVNTLNSIHRRKRQTFDQNQNSFVRNDLTETLQTIDISSLLSGVNISPEDKTECQEPNLNCDPSTPFRTLSGYCNNLRNPSWGKALTTFSRLLPAQYHDGISHPRTMGVGGDPLPNPRTISTTIHPDISNLHSRYSLMTMQFAQFVDHDLTMTPIHKGFHESIPSCRSCNSKQTVHPECNPFPAPPGDYFYPEVNVTSGERLCFPSMRSLPGQQSLGPREQVNQNTHFLDASMIYGEDVCKSGRLRGFSGRLNSTIHPVRGKELLPQTNVHPECKSRSNICYDAGDDRASEQPALTAIHTIFLREHNRLIEGLRGVNPQWNGEQLFQHARRIVSAQIQHITFNEFLPRILSWNAVNLYGLKLIPQGYYKDYNPSCSPIIFNEFAAAAFRIGHSLLRPHIPRLNSQHQPVDPPILLRDGFFKMDFVTQPGIIDEMIRGLIATPMETLDQFITGEVTNHLFEDRKIPFSGIDLIALNVQRARDHGIPSYNNYRALCNLKRASTWDDLSREIPNEVINRFKKIYASVDDIDLFPGSMTERPLQGGLVGPTLACIIGIQFRQLRKCDRFWYENANSEVRFTEAQLAEIRKTTLAKISCENLEISGDMQRAAFDLPSNFLNPRVPCHSMPQIDLAAWRENGQGCHIGNRHVQIGESAFPTPCTSCVCSNAGAQCASLRITDCNQLIRQWPQESILRDEVCNSQCGAYLNGQINFATQSRSSGRPVQGLNYRVQRSRQQNNFKFPDLTPFIASL